MVLLTASVALLACSGRRDPAADAERARASLLGTWQGTAEIAGESLPISLVLEPAPARRGVGTDSRAPSGARPAAGAMVAPGEVAVIGSLTSENPELNGSLDGSLDVGDGLASVRVSLRVDAGITLNGFLQTDALNDGRVEGGDADHSGTFSLFRP